MKRTGAAISSKVIKAMQRKRRTISAVIQVGDGRSVTKSMPGLYFADMAKVLLKELEAPRDGPAREYMVLIAQATALEALLNDEIILAAIHLFGPDAHQDHARALLAANVRDKLILTPPFATGNRFILNRNSPTIQALFAMVARRNKVVHTVAEFEPYAPISDDRHRDTKAELALEVSTAELKRFGEALETFVEQFVLMTDQIEHLAANEVLLVNTASPESH
jgi:hypothetical protein